MPDTSSGVNNPWDIDILKYLEKAKVYIFLIIQFFNGTKIKKNNLKI